MLVRLYYRFYCSSLNSLDCILKRYCLSLTNPYACVKISFGDYMTPPHSISRWNGLLPQRGPIADCLLFVSKNSPLQSVLLLLCVIISNFIIKSLCSSKLNENRFYSVWKQKLDYVLKFFWTPRLYSRWKCEMLSHSINYPERRFCNLNVLRNYKISLIFVYS